MAFSGSFINEKARKFDLGTMYVPTVSAEDNLVESRPELRETVARVRQRGAKLQSPLLTERMVSGHGGFVPQNHFQWGKTCRETCIKSIAELGAEKSVQTSDQCQSSQIPTTTKPTSAAFKTTEEFGANSYIRTHDFINADCVSSYKMANDDPDKHCKSGSADIIPRTHNKIGTNIDVTHTALNEFTDGQKRLDTSSSGSC